MFKKLLMALAAAVVAGAIVLGLKLWPDYTARMTTLNTLSNPNVTLTRYTDTATARQLAADHYRVVLASSDQGDQKRAAYIMRINGVTYWVELTRHGQLVPRETLKRISAFQPAAAK